MPETARPPAADTGVADAGVADTGAADRWAGWGDPSWGRGLFGAASGGACAGVLAEPSGAVGHTGTALRAQAEFDCATPVLPGLESAAPVFRF